MRRAIFFLSLILLLFYLPSETQPSSDSDKDGIPDSIEAALLERFSPYYKFSKDRGNERYRPADAIWAIRHSSLKPEADEGTSTVIENEVLESEPSAVLKANWRNLGSSNIITNPRKTKYALNIYNKYRDGYENGDGFTWNEIKSKGNVGIYGHVVPYGQYYKIEYYQYFGYSDTLKGGAGNWGDHEGEWEIPVQLIYDPRIDKIIRVLHYTHGKEISFDMRLPYSKVFLDLDKDGNIDTMEFRGPNHDISYFDIGGPKQIKGKDWKPEKAVNNLVRFFRDPHTRKYTHPVVYIENGCHGMWPSQYWSYWGAPKHNGDSYSYLTKDIPNLGEVEHPSDENSEIILRYNGRWGAYAGVGTDPPPGPALHWEWTWPPNSSIRNVMSDKSFEDGASIGHHWPAIVETLIALDFERFDGLAAGDVDGDGGNEIIHADRDDKIIIYNGIGKKEYQFNIGEFKAYKGKVGDEYDWYFGDRIAVGDVDGNGIDEIIHASRDDKITIYDYSGSIKIEFEVDFERGDSLSAGDVNGDGVDEIIQADRDDKIIIYDGRTGRKKYEPFKIDFAAGDEITTGDVDGDGIDEIIHGDRDDRIIIYDYLGNIESEFQVDFEREDGLAAGDIYGFSKTIVFYIDDNFQWKVSYGATSPWRRVNSFAGVTIDRYAFAPGNDIAEIIHGDRDNKIIIYDQFGNNIAKFYCDFTRGDGFAIGDVTGNGRSEIIHGSRYNFLKAFSLPSWLWLIRF